MAALCRFVCLKKKRKNTLKRWAKLRFNRLSRRLSVSWTVDQEESINHCEIINNQSRSVVLGGIQQCNKLLLFTAESKRTFTNVYDECTRINSIWYNLWVYKYRTIYWHYVDILAPNERNYLYESFVFCFSLLLLCGQKVSEASAKVFGFLLDVWRGGRSSLFEMC